LTLRWKSEPSDPDSGAFVLWQSNGTGFGDAGDVVIKCASGATVKTITIIDFSAATDEDP